VLFVFAATSSRSTFSLAKIECTTGAVTVKKILQIFGGMYQQPATPDDPFVSVDSAA
jgi:hypothetical protein